MMIPRTAFSLISRTGKPLKPRRRELIGQHAILPSEKGGGVHAKPCGDCVRVISPVESAGEDQQSVRWPGTTRQCPAARMVRYRAQRAQRPGRASKRSMTTCAQGRSRTLCHQAKIDLHPLGRGIYLLHLIDIEGIQSLHAVMWH